MLLKRVNSVKFIKQTEFTCQQRLTGSKSGVTKNVGNRFHTHIFLYKLYKHQNANNKNKHDSFKKNSSKMYYRLHIRSNSIQ